MLGEGWKSVLGVGKERGNVGRSVGGVEECLGVWGSVLGCGRKCREKLGEVWGSVRGVEGGVGRSVGVWGK